MSFQPAFPSNENDNGREVSQAQVHEESDISDELFLPDPISNQHSTIDHVWEGSSHVATPGILWERPGRNLDQRAAAANKYGRKPLNAPDKGRPVALPARYAIYNTEHYIEFNRNEPYSVQRARSFRKGTPWYPIYDQYHLCMDLSIRRAEDVPQLPLRLDDRLCALVYEKFDAKQLSLLWPSEFDARGMVRATRVPLGHAAKHYYNAGDIDYDGNILEPGGEGWYYLWLGGVQCLMGKEGWDAGRYLKRPSHEKEFVGFAFKKPYKAVIQAPPGSEVEDVSNP